MVMRRKTKMGEIMRRREIRWVKRNDKMGEEE